MQTASSARPLRLEVAPRLTHLRRLTDDTGVIQHALGPLPNRATGYTADDNARALVAALLAHQAGDPDGLALAPVYLAFLAYAQGPDGWFHNTFAYDRRPLPEDPSDDCQGRCLWGLAVAARSLAGTRLGWSAAQLFARGLAAAGRIRYLRGHAGVAVACATWLGGEAPQGASDLPEGGPPPAQVRVALTEAASALAEAWEACRGGGWEWFEDVMTYDNALLPYALLRAARVTGSRRYRQAGLATLEFLAEATFRGGVFWPVGNRGWYPRGGRPADFAQQPLEAGAMVLACREAWHLTGDPRWAECAESALAWFLGRNALGISLYDAETGGCQDGLEEEGANRNQGAESTLAWLLAAYTWMAAPVACA